MRVQQMKRDGGPAIFYTTAFRKVLEDHIPYLKEHPQTTTITVPKADLEQFKHNLSGFLSRNIAPQLVWIVMRINGYLHNSQFDGSEDILTVPSAAAIEEIRRLYTTRHTIG